MSDQHPLTPPTPSNPDFEPYDAPAYGAVTPDAPTLRAPGTAGGTGGSSHGGPVDLTKQPGQDDLTAPMPNPMPAAAPTPVPYGQPDPAGHGQPSPDAWAPYPSAPYGSPYGVAPGYAGAYGAPNHPQATAALVLGIVSIAGVVLSPVLIVSFVTVFCSPFAIWFGVRSRREIRSNPHAYSGEGMATAGLVTGIVGAVLGILGLLLILAFVGLIAALIAGS